MSHRSYWYIPGRILLVEYSGVVTIDDLRASLDTMRQLGKTEAKPPYLHIIGDSSPRTTLDKSLFSLKSLAAVTDLQEDKSMFGWTIHVDPSPNTTINFLLNSVAQIIKSRFRTFPAMESCLSFLNEMDATLPPLSVSDLNQIAPS